MRKGMWSAAAFVVVSSGAALLWVPTVQAADNRVGMNDQLSYDPPDISVPVNTPLVFRNDGNIPHDAKAEDNSFATPLLDPGKEHTVTFRTPGATIKYFCTVEGHKAAGMIGTVRVTEAGSTPTPAPTTPTTAAGGSTAATAAGAATTTTTAKPAAGTGGSTTTTTAASAGGATTTSIAPSVTPTSAPETAGETTTTTAAAPQNGGGEEAAADDHASEGASTKDKKKSSPIGIAFAAVSTLLLTAIAGKLLASKS